ncbi:hypothetical protein HHK36_031117 [Tetracentron sinense]|uniref:Uncharacterized protein n=1 Tax=Tetracentron sinense TaxID=13715 RepID=A0A834YAE6_TETSI|nr:hypothetical protein HHK36_031117 [Tetracentron sinense]
MSCPNFNALRDSRDSVNDLLRSPVTQKALVHHQWVDEVSEACLRMLEACGTTRDVLLLAKEHLQDLQSALRRRNLGGQGLEKKIGAYNLFRKKMRKEMVKCLGTLKGMRNRCATSHLSTMDHNLTVVVDVLKGVRVTTISIIESLLSISRPKQNATRRFFMSKFMRASEENVMNEGEVDKALCTALHGHNLWGKPDIVGLQAANKQLEALELAIEGLEVELECIFRRLIQTRVSLLNILNN